MSRPSLATNGLEVDIPIGPQASEGEKIRFLFPHSGRMIMAYTEKESAAWNDRITCLTFSQEKREEYNSEIVEWFD